MPTPIFQILLAFILGLIIVSYAIPIIVRIAKEKHLFDEPNSRRVNKVPVPNLGGVALFMGISIGSMVAFQKNSFPDYRYLLICTTIMLFIGVQDDLLIISARKKLLAQLVCAFVLVALGDIRFTNFHGIFGVYEINNLASYVFSTLAIVSIINAINLIDGIDGLASSLSIVATVVLGVNFYLIGEVNFAILCSAIVGSLISFFSFNVFSKLNKIFMGDTGALILGLLVAALIVKFNELAISQQNNGLIHFAPIVTLAVIAIPLFDMTRLFLMRIIRKSSPFSPDMNHIHHKFLKLGYSHKVITGIIASYNLLLIATVYMLRPLNNHYLAFYIITMVALFMVLPQLILWFRKSRSSKSHRLPAMKIRFHSKTSLAVAHNTHPEIEPAVTE